MQVGPHYSLLLDSSRCVPVGPGVCTQPFGGAAARPHACGCRAAAVPLPCPSAPWRSTPAVTPAFLCCSHVPFHATTGPWCLQFAQTPPAFLHTNPYCIPPSSAPVLQGTWPSFHVLVQAPGRTVVELCCFPLRTSLNSRTPHNPVTLSLFPSFCGI